MIIVGSSNIGNVRKDNEDSFIFDSYSEKYSFSIVCDGMGGVAGGKIASQICCDTIHDVILKSNLDNLTDAEIKNLLVSAVDKANKSINEKSKEDKTLKGMGTTAVVAIFNNERAYFANIGDSRAYLINDSIKKITHDHSAVQELVDMGKITENEAKNHPKKNIITRAIGVDKSVAVDFYIEDLKKGDIIIICTDGLSNMLSDDEIFSITKEGLTFESVPQSLISEALNHGGNDNITALAVKI